MGLWYGKVGLFVTLGLWMLASLAIGLPRSIVSPFESELRALITLNEQCPQPCWEGIRPAITSAGDAVARLKTLAWVGNISAIQGIVTSDSIIRWQWKGQQASIIDGEREGTIWLHKGFVYSIELPLKVSFAEVWQAAGKPQDTLIIKAPRANPTVFYHALYIDGLIDLNGVTPCPLNAWNLLSMRVDAHFAAEKPRSPIQQSERDGQTLCK